MVKNITKSLLPAVLQYARLGVKVAQSRVQVLSTIEVYAESRKRRESEEKKRLAQNRREGSSGIVSNLSGFTLFNHQ